MVRRQYVCRGCKRFTTDKVCPICGSKDLSASWKGIAVINDSKESKIAKVLGIEASGKYALFVG